MGKLSVLDFSLNVFQILICAFFALIHVKIGGIQAFFHLIQAFIGLIHIISNKWKLDDRV